MVERMAIAIYIEIVKLIKSDSARAILTRVFLPRSVMYSSQFSDKLNKSKF